MDNKKQKETKPKIAKDKSNPTRRNWCFTLINPSEKQKENIRSIGKETCKCIIFGEEYTSDGKPHLQGYIEVNKPVRLGGIKTILDPIDGKKSTIHVEEAKGNREQNFEYCSKGSQSHDEYKSQGVRGANYGKDAVIYKQIFKEKGEGQGKRNDWTKLYDEIRDSADFASILEKYPEYCIKYPTGIQKAIDIAKQTKSKLDLEEELENLRLYKWQSKLVQELRRKANARKIKWYVDTKGGCGKTTFAKWLLSKGDCAYFTNGKTADISHAYNGERCVVFDFTRSIEGAVNYGVIEAIKNGIVFSSKYNSGTKVHAVPHVVCFSNFDPDRSKLSEDRWDIKHLTDEDCTHTLPEDKFYEDLAYAYEITDSEEYFEHMCKCIEEPLEGFEEPRIELALPLLENCNQLTQGKLEVDSNHVDQPVPIYHFNMIDDIRPPIVDISNTLYGTLMTTTPPVNLWGSQDWSTSPSLTIK